MAKKKVTEKKPKATKKEVVKKAFSKEIKPMFAGLIWRGKVINNNTLTEKLYKELVENHPLGEKLFK